MTGTEHITTTSHFLDGFSLLTIFGLTLVLQLIAIEAGYRVGSRPQLKVNKTQTSQVRAIMGAGLGLLAFMLAFTFAASQAHYETRVEAMVEEARLVRTAYLEAAFLPESFRERARALLREYAADRVEAQQALREADRAKVRSIIRKSEQMQQELWQLAVDQARERPGTRGTDEQSDRFQASILGLIDVHVARIEAGALNRIPNILWIALCLMAVLSMLVMGYQAGLVGRRSPMATVTLAVAFATVIVLITDLDRPVHSLFQVNDQVMVDLARKMSSGDADG